MTVCAPQSTPQSTPRSGSKDLRRPAFTVTANGSYAARLALDGATGGWFPERWTLDGPEPYAVPLPGSQPEEPDSEVQPLADGRVLIRRRVAERHTLSLLYPTGPGTGELPVGAVECDRLSLLPPAPGGSSVYGLVHAERATALWRLHGGAFGPERVVDVPGCCTGGAWLDRTGRLLALDRELDGRTKTVVVDLERGGETSPLLQITEDSNDRLLLADPYSGLLLVRSDAPGQDRLGWGVLGSARPVRFPECLRPAGAVLTPFATQPGQELTPEGCAVAFRVEGATGSWVGVWRPAGKQLQQFPAPAGWLVGAGLWTSGGELRLPFVTPYVRCGLARLRLPEAERGETRDTGGRGGAPAGAGPAATGGAAGAAATGVPRPEPAAAPGAPSAPATLLQGVPRPTPDQAPSDGRPAQQPLLQGPPRAAEPAPSGEVQRPLLQGVPRVGEQASSGGPQQPLLQGVRRPEPAPSGGVQQPLLQGVAHTAPQVSRPAPEAQPLLHEVPRPGLGQEQPLLQGASPRTEPRVPRPTPDQASPAAPQQTSQAQPPLLHKAPQPGPSGAGQAPLGAPQAPLLREAPQPVPPPLPRREAASTAASSQPPLLHEAPRPVPPPLSRPEASAGPLPQPPLPGEAPRSVSAQLPRPEQASSGVPQAPLLREAPQPLPPQTPRPEPVAAAPPQPAPPQPMPLLREVPRPVTSAPCPAPCPEPQLPPMRDVSRVDMPPPPAAPQDTPPQGVPLLERPHEGLSPGAPQGPVSMPPLDVLAPVERAESPASVWTAVDPTCPSGLSGLPGAAMPGAWSAAASRPVPLQQAPLGREPRT
ncbi:hypothetical protein [Streptomyces sp. NRRL B-1677]|uniref:hypothetical protein n=1 Tax=Streptomyces sp. NRRL B-1677 TaxID=2682966 RepID=UPI002B4AF52D|nr:hypothetical protein [Streptomyces sp. NRRL B-1677]